MIVAELPEGLRGLILAGIFAAAISSLDSILAALSQTTMSLMRKEGGRTNQESNKADLFLSRSFLVVGWGITSSAFAIGLFYMKGEVNVVVLAFGMTYTVGPMLVFLAAYFTGKFNGVDRGLLHIIWARSFDQIGCLGRP